MTDEPIYILLDNGKCIVIDYYFIDNLGIEYGQMMLVLKLKNFNKGVTEKSTVIPQILICSKQRKATLLFRRKDMPSLIKKSGVFHKWSKHVVKVKIWHFFEKIEKP